MAEVRRSKGHGVPVLRFSKIRIENWRNFLSVEQRLEGRVFLVGPNASGKTNLLDVFRFLRDLASVGGGLQEAVRKRGGVSKLRCLSARQNTVIVIDVELTGGPEGPLRYELHFSHDEQQRAVVKKERVSRGGVELFAPRPTDDDRKDRERLTQTNLEQVNVNQPFRDLVQALASVRYLHLVPQLVRDPNRSAGLSNDPFGGDFLEQVALTPEKTQKARLRRIEKALRVAVPQLREIEMKRDARGTPHLRGRYEHWRPKGAWQSEDQFSDGTLRLMGLLWALLDDGGPLLLEEPELSLHPEVVRFLPQVIAGIQRKSGRQVLVSTHSTDLLRDGGIDPDEVLLLKPGVEGTSVQAAGTLRDVRALLEGGLSMADAIMPRTRPQDAAQLTFIGF